MMALAVLGAADAVSVVIRMTLVQIETPDAMRGRVNAVNSLFAGTSNQLGDFRAGVMAAWLGAIPAVLVGGIGILVVVLVWMRVFPALKHVDSFYAKKSDHPPGRTLVLRRRPRLPQPVVEERRQPGPPRGIVDCAIGEMRDARLGVGQQHAFVPARGPAAHHGVGHVGMELQRIGAPPKRNACTGKSRPRPAARRRAAGRSPRDAIDRPGPAKCRRPRGPQSVGRIG